MFAKRSFPTYPEVNQITREIIGNTGAGVMRSHPHLSAPKMGCTGRFPHLRKAGYETSIPR